MVAPSTSQPRFKCLNDLARAALATNDGLLLPDYINALASYEGDPLVRSSTLIQIAEKQPFASHLVVGVLSGLALNNLPDAKEFARRLIASPLDREKDLIVARAHTVLLELPPIDVRDVPVIAAGLVHPFDQVREAVGRALTFVPLHSATVLSNEVAKIPRTRGVEALAGRLDAILRDKAARLATIDGSELSDLASPKERRNSRPPSAAKPQRPRLASVPKPQVVRDDVERRNSVRSVKLPSEETLLPSRVNSTTTNTQSTHVPLVTLDEFRTVPIDHLHHVCQSAADATQFAYALGEIINRCGEDAGRRHCGRFVHFASQPVYPRELFGQLSSRLFASN